MMIALANSKGGVGKTTIAVHLAAWLHEDGNPTVLVDCDPQRSSSHWLREAHPDIETFQFSDADEVLSELPRLRKSGSFVVLDGPAGLDEISRAILVHADKVIVPSKAGTLEARALLRATKAISQVQEIPGRSGKPEATIVLTMVSDRFLLTREMKEAALSLGFPVAVTMLRQRQCYALAPGHGKTLFQLGKKAAPAPQELVALFQELFPEIASVKQTNDFLGVGNG